MSYRLLRVVSVALVSIGAAAPGSATGVTRTTAAAPAPGSLKHPAPPRRGVHYLRRAGSHTFVNVTGPSGCTTNGPSSFVGEPGSSSGGLNYAGGGTPPNGGYAGVVAGEGNEACDILSTVGGGFDNIAGGDGSAFESGILAGGGNRIESAQGGFIGAGGNNLIGLAPPFNNSGGSAIVSGIGNTVATPSSFIGAGFRNSIIGGSLGPFGSGGLSFVGAGDSNAVASNYAGIVSGTSNSVAADNSAILGGSTNNVSGQFSTIGGGYTNNLTGQYSVIGGGYGNVVSGLVATVGGGYANTASGQNATIAGGASNVASGVDSFAAGHGSKAAHTGAFVWSDDSKDAKVLTSTASNQFLARAAGGFFLYSTANLSTGVKLAPGSGSWSSVSDRAAKTAIEDIDDARILAKVASLPVSEWSYSAQGTGVRHLGPMAQDFRAAFGLGEDERHIATVDEEGVALAAIKGLQAELLEKDRELNDLDAKYSRLEQRLDALEETSQTNNVHSGS